MKRAIGVALAGVLLTFVSQARAEKDDDDAMVPVAPLLGEADDAWLHEHCAYRGLGFLPGSSSAGRVIEQVGVGAASFHKAFICAERPAFWSGAWSPATAEAVACKEPRASNELCVPPLERVAVPVAPPPPVPAVRALPPSMPEPTPPKKVVRAARPAPRPPVRPRA